MSRFIPSMDGMAVDNAGNSNSGVLTIAVEVMGLCTAVHGSSSSAGVISTTSTARAAQTTTYLEKLPIGFPVFLVMRDTTSQLHDKVCQRVCEIHVLAATLIFGCGKLFSPPR